MTTTDEEAANDRRTQRVTRFYARYVGGRENCRLLFGEPCKTLKRVGQGGAVFKVYSFTPGARFAIDLWASNTYGTIRWRCFVCEATAPGEVVDMVPFVVPAARVLLHAQGAAQSRLFLSWLLCITESGVDPVTCPPETFEAAHFRLHGSRADRTPAQRLSGRL
jgi:hypothetical protein